MREKSSYDNNICEALDISLTVFYNIINKLTDSEYQYLYFYMGGYFATQKNIKVTIDNNDLKTNELLMKSKKIINKYLREDKLKRLLFLKNII